MPMTNRFLGFITLCLGVCILLFTVHPRITASRYLKIQNHRRELVKALGLTDLCLFTEARYTRHISMADLHSPFQEHPLALEHFPSGAMLLPPPAFTPNPLNDTP